MSGKVIQQTINANIIRLFLGYILKVDDGQRINFSCGWFVVWVNNLDKIGHWLISWLDFAITYFISVHGRALSLLVIFFFRSETHMGCKYRKSKILNILMAFVLFVSFLIACSAPNQPYSIIFSAALKGDQDLYRISGPDFQTLERITFTPNEPETNLKLSKNGKRFIYSISTPNLANYSIVVELETGKRIELDNPSIGSGIALGWFANGDNVVLLNEHIPKLYSVKIQGKSVEDLDILHNYDFSIVEDLDFSSDGKYLAYTEYHQTPNFLSTKSSFILNVETKQVAHLFADKETATCDKPLWSPSREQLLLYCNLDSTDTAIDRHVYLLNISGDSLAIDDVANIPCYDSFSWSPSGDQFIAYCKVENKTASLVIYNFDGSVLRTLDMIDMRIWEMSWSPDGQSIIYIAGDDRNYANIYIMNSDGSGNHVITTEPSNYSHLLVYSLER